MPLSPGAGRRLLRCGTFWEDFHPDACRIGIKPGWHFATYLRSEVRDRHDNNTEAKHNNMTELALYFLRLGFLGFGGPVALVGQMERELVNDKKWLTKEQMRESIAICQ